MLIMPAVDIKNGKCVQLVQGKPGSEQVIIDNPENVAKFWEDKGANIIHVIDLDGTIDGKSNINIIKDILDNVTVPIQLGGGIRSVEYAEKLLNLTRQKDETDEEYAKRIKETWEQNLQISEETNDYA